MTIHGLDISPFQENPLFNQFIDWKALKSDPLGFRFIWIKCAEATDGTGYVEDATRQVKGAKSVGFEIIAPYSYYLFRWYAPAEDRWYVFDTEAMAQAFYAAASASGFPPDQPMLDLEDPLIRQFLKWDTTANFNASLLFAVNLVRHIHRFLQAVERLFHVKPSCYSGKWWLDLFVPPLIANGYLYEVLWMKEYDWILADYVGGLEIPDYVGRVIAWQKTSTPTPPVQGIPTGHLLPGDALDVDEWLLSEPAFLDWTKGKAQMASRAYLFPPSEAPRIITITSEDARATLAPKSLGVDAMIIRSGGANGPGYTVFQDVAWDNRQASAAPEVPVVGWFELDPAWYLGNGVDKGMVIDRSGHPDRQPVLLQVLRCLNQNPSLGWGDAGPVNPDPWRKLSGVMFSQENETFKGSPVGDFWFSLSIADVIDQLRTLILGGVVPPVAIILQLAPEIFTKYPTLYNWIEQRKDWLYLAYAGASVRTLAIGHTDIPSLGECWPWTWYNIDPDRYSWYLPDGYAGRILFHETTKDRMFTPVYKTSLLENRPVRLSLSPIARPDFQKILAPVVAPPPGEDPQIAALKAQVGELTRQVASLRTELQTWWDWYGKAPSLPG